MAEHVLCSQCCRRDFRFRLYGKLSELLFVGEGANAGSLRVAETLRCVHR